MSDRTPGERIRERLDDPELAALRGLRDQAVGPNGWRLSTDAVKAQTRRILGTERT